MQDNNKKARARIRELRKKVDSPHLVCDAEDLLPYAWRTPPVVDGRKCSKVLKQMAEAEEERLRPLAPKK